MAKPVEFLKYNGWSNYATWAVFTHISDDERLCLIYEKLAREGGVQEHLSKKMKGFFFITYRDEGREMLMKDWLGCAINSVEWPLVLCMLRDQPLYQEPTILEEAAVSFFGAIPTSGIWQTIVIDAKGGEDSALKEWALESMITWIESPDARAHTNSPVSCFARELFDIVIGSVDWERLTKALKGE